MTERATYTHGHHASVVASHARRTVQDSAAFLLSHVKPEYKILDLGCGPGSITIGLAKLASKGHVTGGDASEDIVQQAQSLAQAQHVHNVTFTQIDGNSLPYEDDSFDIVFAHQVLQHVAEPVAMLKEMRRVTKPGGLVAARDADTRSFAWYPVLPKLDDWIDLYIMTARANNAEPNAGRYYPSWAKQAGFATEELDFTWSVWNYQGEQGKAYSRDWVDRALYSGFATAAKQHGLATEEDLKDISNAFRDFSETEGCFFIIPSGEILCRKR